MKPANSSGKPIGAAVAVTDWVAVELASADEGWVVAAEADRVAWLVEAAGVEALLVAEVPLALGVTAGSELAGTAMVLEETAAGCEVDASEAQAVRAKGRARNSPRAAWTRIVCCCWVTHPFNRVAQPCVARRASRTVARPVGTAMLAPDLDKCFTCAVLISRRHVLTGAASGLLLCSPLLADAATAPRASRLARWSGKDFGAGRHAGTATTSAGLVFVRPSSSWAWADPHGGRKWTFDVATWTSPVVITGIAATSLVPSWIASTPVRTAIRVRVRARNQSGTWSQWTTVALWASSGEGPVRSSQPATADAVAKTATDTLKAAAGVTFSAWQVAIDLLRPRGTTIAPVVRQVAGVSATPIQSATPVSRFGPGGAVQLAVPAYSQMLHKSHYPSLDGGGAAWCSATSMAMLLDYWKKGPTSTETAWVRPTPHQNPQVDHVARGVYDIGYQGTGNWSFNVAYAGARGLTGFVTRLRSLADAERFVRAGIPLAVSTAFASTQLAGAGFSTPGHLMVLRGFDAAGDVRVNDPASALRASNALVSKTYARAQFESAWGRSGGLTYVVLPIGRALPSRTTGAAW